jgi:hypothetical protein
MLDRLKRLEAEALLEVARAPGCTADVLRMVDAHLKKPWIVGHRAILIRPLKPRLGKFFKAPVTRSREHVWYFPSTTWWMAHANASHPPKGVGCDVRVHADFLSQAGKHAEFAYASLLGDGRIHVLDQNDFLIECAWWKGEI